MKSLILHCFESIENVNDRYNRLAGYPKVTNLNHLHTCYTLFEFDQLF